MADKTNVFTALIKAQPHFMEKPLEELLPMRFMGDAAIAAYRSILRHLDDLNLSVEEKASRLKDGQDAGRALLMIEARIGELLPSVDAIQKMGKGGSRRGPDGVLRRGGSERALPEGMKPRHAQRARAIAAHPKEVAEVIDEAIENEDIPTKTAVLNKISYKQEKARAKGKREKLLLELTLAEKTYHDALLQASALIPTRPPKEITERGFAAIQPIARLIIKKLEPFNEPNKSHTSASRILSQGE